jgi:hypothetical protein
VRGGAHLDIREVPGVLAVVVGAKLETEDVEATTNRGLSVLDEGPDVVVGSKVRPLHLQADTVTDKNLLGADLASKAVGLTRAQGRVEGAGVGDIPAAGTKSENLRGVGQGESDVDRLVEGAVVGVELDVVGGGGVGSREEAEEATTKAAAGNRGGVAEVGPVGGAGGGHVEGGGGGAGVLALDPGVGDGGVAWDGIGSLVVDLSGVQDGVGLEWRDWVVVIGSVDGHVVARQGRLVQIAQGSAHTGLKFRGKGLPWLGHSGLKSLEFKIRNRSIKNLAGRRVDGAVIGVGQGSSRRQSALGLLVLGIVLNNPGSKGLMDGLGISVLAIGGHSSPLSGQPSGGGRSLVVLQGIKMR